MNINTCRLHVKSFWRNYFEGPIRLSQQSRALALAAAESFPGAKARVWRSSYGTAKAAPFNPAKQPRFSGAGLLIRHQAGFFVLAEDRVSAFVGGGSGE